MRTLKRTGALVSALFLALCLAFQPVLAAGGPEPPAGTAEPAAPSPSGGETNHVPPSSPPESAPAPTPTPTSEPTPTPTPGLTQSPAPEPAVVSTWAELTAWLDANWQTGGEVRLDADVTADGPYDLMGDKDVFQIQPLTVDCGEHTIYIDGGPGKIVSLTTANFKLTIRGHGGGEGLIQVRPGGTLMLDMLNLEAREGAAVVQAEGGVLMVTQEDKGYEAPPRVTGEIVYAQAPVLTTQDRTRPYLAVVPDGQPLTEDLLPGTVEAKLNYRGELSKTLEQPVVWDLEAEGPQLERRERTVLTGRLAGALSWNGQTWAEGAYEPHGESACIAAFLEDGAALLDLRLQRTSGALLGGVCFRAEPGAEALRLLTSVDGGQTWEEQDACSGADAAETGEGDFDLCLEDPAYPVWLLVEAIYPDGRTVHTDTVSVDEDQVAPATWGDGHRGGGEPIRPPENTNPPVENQPDVNDPNDRPSVHIPPADGVGGGTAVIPPTPTPDTAPSPSPGTGSVQEAETEPPQSARPERTPSAAAETAPASATPIVPQAEAAVQSTPAVPALGPPPAAGQEEPGGLHPAAQLALGGTAAAALCAGAVAFFNPKPLKRLLKRLLRK